jgi:hypothetical protein
MNSPLIVDPEDSKWLPLEQVLAVTTGRRSKQEMAKQGITYVIEELQKRGLRQFTHIDQTPSVDETYQFLARSTKKDLFP